MAIDLEAGASDSPHFRFSLKFLLFIITVSCIVFAPVAWFGSFYLTSALMSSALIALSVGAYYGKQTGLMLAVAAAAVGIGFVSMTIVFLMHALLNGLACAIGAALQVRTRTFAVMLCGAGVALYAMVLNNGAKGVRELIALKQEYPLISVAHRLAFERTADNVDSTNFISSEFDSSQLSALVLANLAAREQREPREMQRRIWALRELHENVNRHFAAAAGFGAIRMMTVRPRMVELYTRPFVELPFALPQLSTNADSKQLYKLHQETLFGFVEPERIGFVRNRDAVAGFESHSFANPYLNSRDESSWQVNRLELVSLLRHTEPRVYVDEILPKMDDLDNIPHRSLDGFEARSLPKLQHDHDVIVEPTAERILMLGAVRAGTDCLDCHDGTRGELLGAFSYELTPIVAMQNEL